MFRLTTGMFRSAIESLPSLTAKSSCRTGKITIHDGNIAVRYRNIAIDDSNVVIQYGMVEVGDRNMEICNHIIPMDSDLSGYFSSSRITQLVETMQNHAMCCEVACFLRNLHSFRQEKN
jgi:hypothetical protein